MIERHRGQAFFGVACLTADEIPPERQVFDHAERGFQRVAMAEIVGLFG